MDSRSLETRSLTPPIAFDNSYARLPAPFFARVEPSAASQPRLIELNRALAQRLGLNADALASAEGVEILAGKRVPEGADPIATAYAGHQFGAFVPQLGDGRAILLGEVVDRDGVRRDIQLKGSGQTPFSRRGDGLAALGPVLREYIVSEAMAALGVPTTRALAALLTGEQVVREALLPGAVFVRVALSHIRVGTFQYFAARGDTASLKALADYAIARHDPQALETPQPYRAFLEAVTTRQAELVARWMTIGFIHGVMNTDNTSISGETIDYGPCAFMDTYHPAKVFSSIDQHGRYAYANQPRIAQWNLARLAECLLPLLSEDDGEAVKQAEAILTGFSKTFHAAHLAGMRRKLGLFTEHDGDAALAQEFLEHMAAGEADFTLAFRRLCDAALGAEQDHAVRALFADPAAFDGWSAKWRERLGAEPQSGPERRQAMRAVNPAFVPRNHRIEEVIRAGVDANDFEPFERLVAVLAAPFDDQPENAEYADPPRPEERVQRTFCGT